MLGFEPELLELVVSLLIVAFALAILFLLQLEDFLERCLLDRRRDIVFFVEILKARTQSCQ